MPAVPDVTLRYLELPNKLFGRGGAVRILCLAAGIPCKEDLTTLGAWPELKQELVKNGESPLGVLPVTVVDGNSKIEHLSVVRYIARLIGAYGVDAESDYLADVVVDNHVTMRDDWAAGVLGDDSVKAAYAAKRARFYKALEAILTYTGADGASAIKGGKLAYADPILFGILWDDVKLYDDGLLKASPKLSAFYTAFLALPAVKAWCEGP